MASNGKNPRLRYQRIERHGGRGNLARICTAEWSEPQQQETIRWSPRQQFEDISYLIVAVRRPLTG